MLLSEILTQKDQLKLAHQYLTKNGFKSELTSIFVKVLGAFHSVHLYYDENLDEWMVVWYRHGAKTHREEFKSFEDAIDSIKSLKPVVVEMLTKDDQYNLMKRLLTQAGYTVRNSSLRNKPCLEARAGWRASTACVRIVYSDKTDSWDAQWLSGQGHKMDYGHKGVGEEKVIDYVKASLGLAPIAEAEQSYDDAPMTWRTVGSLLKNGKEVYCYVNLYDTKKRRNKPTELLKITAALKKGEMYVFYVGNLSDWFELTEDDDDAITVSKRDDGSYWMHFIKKPKTGFMV